jgi:uncharacterized protein YbjQ (UPF0145 family)
VRKGKKKMMNEARALATKQMIAEAEALGAIKRVLEKSSTL